MDEEKPASELLQKEMQRRGEVIGRHYLNWIRSHQGLLTRESLRAFLDAFREDRAEFEHPRTLVHFRCVERGVESVELFEQREDDEDFQKVIGDHIAKHYPGDKVRIIQTLNFEKVSDDELKDWIDSFWSDQLLLPQQLKGNVNFISPISRGEMELEMKEEIYNNITPGLTSVRD